MIRPQSCPICGKNVAPATDPTSSTAPFCSRRCQQIDFFRWSEGKYSIVEALRPTDLEDSSTEDLLAEDMPDE